MMIAMLIAAAAHTWSPIPLRENTRWVCDGPKFDSTCSPSSGIGACHVFFGNVTLGAKAKGRTLAPKRFPPSYADNGRIAYCDWKGHGAE